MNLKEEAAFEERESLLTRAIRGGVLASGSFGFQQLLRFGGNLLLTRLLVPEAFGLMALVHTFILGLAMFSDIGVGPCIIQSEKGGQPQFLNTAWTMQVIRGAMLWCCTVLLAFPLAKLYDQPALVQLLPFVGLSVFIGGFVSTKEAEANRRVALRSIVLMQTFSALGGMLSMVYLTYCWRSVWGLAVGGLVGPLITVILSHTFIKGTANRFQWDGESAKAIYHFGRWIFLSTILTFFPNMPILLTLGIFGPLFRAWKASLPHSSARLRPFSKKNRQFSQFILHEYSLEREKEDVLRFWQKLL